MKKILLASAMSTALIAGTAFAQTLETETGVTGEVETGVTGEVGATGEAGVDADIHTGAIGGGAEADVSTWLGGLGVEAQGFFTDETMTELAADDEIQANFEALDMETQAQIRAECAQFGTMTADDAAAMARLCAAIDAS